MRSGRLESHDDSFWLTKQASEPGQTVTVTECAYKVTSSYNTETKDSKILLMQKTK